MDAKWQAYFDKGVERRGTDCIKWDSLGRDFGNPDAIPLWIADMDFSTPQGVIDALVQRAQHGAFGYAIFGDKEFNALHNWMLTRHGLDIKQESVLCSEGVVDSMVFTLRAMARPGSKIAIFNPVYGPFFSMSKIAGFEQYLSPLLLTEKGWRMDLDNLEKGFRTENVSVLMLCNPHNPIGRVWTKEELTALIALCNKYDVKILSDEIHMDFEMPGYKQTPLLTLPGTENAVMLCSATKTFNLAALRHSSIIAPNEAIRKAIKEEMTRCMAASPNLFGYLAQTAAYTCGAEWLDNLLLYLDGNRQFVENYLAEKLPMLRSERIEGTYLKLIDMRALGMEEKALMEFLSKKAGCAFGNGSGFGSAAVGYVRMNIATQRKNLVIAMENLEKAVRAL